MEGELSTRGHGGPLARGSGVAPSFGFEHEGVYPGGGGGQRGLAANALGGEMGIALRQRDAERASGTQLTGYGQRPRVQPHELLPRRARFRCPRSFFHERLLPDENARIAEAAPTPECRRRCLAR
jgi:hypothetical protein